MNDFYREILIKRKQKPLDSLKKAGMIALTLLAAAAAFFIHVLFLPAAIVLGVLSWFVISGLDLEYEDLYVNGDIDIDRIMNKQRRKRAASYAIGSLELLAPSASRELDTYRNGKNVKEIDFSSGDEAARTVTAVYSREGGFDLVKLELDDDLVKDMRRYAPRKISQEFWVDRARTL